MHSPHIHAHVLKFSRARLRAGVAGMSPQRLEEEQKLLYDALTAIWSRLAGWVVLAVTLAALLFGGTTVGVIIGTRRALSQTAAIINSQQVQIDLNARRIKEQQAKDQEDGRDRRRLIELLSKAAKNLPRR